MEIDNFDIYGDLENFDYAEQLRMKSIELESLTDQMNKLIEKLTNVEQENTKLKKERGTLARNISSLAKTARSEIQRKDQMITNLRNEKDSIIFRRKAPPTGMDELIKQTQSIGIQTESFLSDILKTRPEIDIISVDEASSMINDDQNPIWQKILSTQTQPNNQPPISVLADGKSAAPRQNPFSKNITQSNRTEFDDRRSGSIRKERRGDSRYGDFRNFIENSEREIIRERDRIEKQSIERNVRHTSPNRNHTRSKSYDRNTDRERNRNERRRSPARHTDYSRSKSRDRKTNHIVPSSKGNDAPKVDRKKNDLNPLSVNGRKRVQSNDKTAQPPLKISKVEPVTKRSRRHTVDERPSRDEEAYKTYVSDKLKKLDKEVPNSGNKKTVENSTNRRSNSMDIDIDLTVQHDARKQSDSIIALFTSPIKPSDVLPLNAVVDNGSLFRSVEKQPNKVDNTGEKSEGEITDDDDDPIVAPILPKPAVQQLKNEEKSVIPPATKPKQTPKSSLPVESKIRKPSNSMKFDNSYRIPKLLKSSAERSKPSLELLQRDEKTQRTAADLQINIVTSSNKSQSKSPDGTVKRNMTPTSVPLKDPIKPSTGDISVQETESIQVPSTDKKSTEILVSVPLTESTVNAIEFLQVSKCSDLPELIDSNEVKLNNNPIDEKSMDQIENKEKPTKSNETESVINKQITEIVSEPINSIDRTVLTNDEILNRSNDQLNTTNVRDYIVEAVNDKEINIFITRKRRSKARKGN